MTELVVRIAKVRSSYDALAEEYAKHISGELDQRPVERDLLRRFAEQHRGRGVVCDLGCGPGHVARYVGQFHPDVIGLDLSWRSLLQARQLKPEVLFLQGDMLALPFASEELSGVISFYSIIHFDAPEVVVALAEMQRVLKKRGGLLLGFHVGTETVHADEVFGVSVDLDAQFFIMEDLASRLNKLGFSIIETIQREPYPEIEYQSVRGYIWAVRSG